MRKFADSNLRMVTAMRNIGRGHAGVQEFCRLFDVSGIS